MLYKKYSIIFYSSISLGSFGTLSKIPVTIRAIAPSPVTLQAVPNESWRANIESIRAVPVSLNPKTEIINPKLATTVPPGTPGAAIAKIPSNAINTIIFAFDGTCPVKICETVITKNTSVKTEPQRCVLAQSGITKSLIFGFNVFDFLAHFKATERVAADDIVPKAVR